MSSRALSGDLPLPAGGLPTWSERLVSDVADELDAASAVADENGAPSRALEAVRRSDLPGAAIPTASGGLGLSARELNDLVEDIAYRDASLAIVLYQHWAVSSRIVEWGTDLQRDRFLPRLATGEFLAASAWSEIGAGAAKHRLATLASPHRSKGWTLNGTKDFVTGAGLADLYLVLAKSSDPEREADPTAYAVDGQTFFLVKASSRGLETAPGPPLVGMRGSSTGRVLLRDCVVPRGGELGPVGAANRVIATIREHGVTLGAAAVGVAQRAYDVTFAQLQQRRALDQPHVRRRLVDIDARIRAGRALVRVAGASDTPDRGSATVYSKLFAAEECGTAVTDCLQLLGASTFVESHPINRYARDVRAVALMGPTSDVCRDIVASTWLT